MYQVESIKHLIKHTSKPVKLFIYTKVDKALTCAITDMSRFGSKKAASQYPGILSRP